MLIEAVGTAGEGVSVAPGKTAVGERVIWLIRPHKFPRMPTPLRIRNVRLFMRVLAGSKSGNGSRIP